MNFDRSCAISTVGSWKCWGPYEQLGYEDTDDRGDAGGEMGDALPVVNLGSGLLADDVQYGVEHVCVLFTTKQLKCFGEGSRGALGYGDMTDRLTNLANNLPFVDMGDSNGGAVFMSVGHKHVCVVLTTSDIKCWGAGTDYALGLGDQNDQLSAGDSLPVVSLGTSFTTTLFSTATSTSTTRTTSASSSTSL
eukprot:6468057-Amphidinium_carterae.1